MADPTPTFHEIARDFFSRPVAEIQKRLDWLEKNNPEGYKKLNQYAQSNKGMLDEAKGYEHWLRKFGPHTFTGTFSYFHHEFWQWYFPIAMRLREGEALDSDDLVALLPWARDSGKCLAAGTEVLLADGTRIPVETVQAGDRLLSVDQATGRSVPDVVERAWHTGTKDCVRLTTRTGKQVDLTPEHRLWGFDGWKPVSEIQIGERVAVPRRTRPQATADRSDAEVKLVAYMIAEGCTVAVRSPCTGLPIATSRTGFTNADAVIVEDFYRSAESLGFRVHQVQHTDGRALISYRLNGSQQWLRDNGLGGKGAHEKRVPQWVFQLPERQRWLFLAVMIDTDGWVCQADGVSIALANEPLIQDLVYLFASVGVVSNIHFKSNDCRGAWVLEVDNECLRRCAEHLPLILKHLKLGAVARRTELSLIDTYPRSVAKGLAPGVNRRIRNAGGPHVSAHPTSRITRAKIRRALAYCAVPRWLWLEQAEVFWDEVVSIEPVGARETYDLEMTSPSHNFIANGIVSHNSSHSEWAAIAEGCLVRKGYVLWVSGKQEQAEEHIVSIRDRIESEQIGKVYPWMSKPKIGAYNNKFGWGKEFLMTADPRGGGWAVRPAGLNVALRGGKVLDMRPTLIVLSDIDEIGDSIMVVENKEMTIARSILPMGDAMTRILFDQNPIHANSVMNRVLTRASSILAVRRVIGGGPVPAFKEDLQIEFEQTDHGPRHIIKKGTPTWADMDIKKCQVFLDRSGLEAFQAEYMHDLTATEEERVLPEYDDRVTRANVITWSQFESKYGMRRIPSDWSIDVGLDIGYSTGHRSAFTFLAKVPQGVSLSGSVFRYRGCVFTATTIGDMSIAVKRLLQPGEKLEREFMSHEKLGERMVLNNEHGWHFTTCDSAKTAGLAQWRHLLRADRSRPHPFHRDEKGLDGLWKIGCPAWFDITEDDQLFAPRDDRGLKVHRDQAFNWRLRRTKMTEGGITVEQPIKADEDSCDATRMCLADANFGPLSRAMTPAEKLQALIPVEYRKESLEKRTDIPPDQKQMTGDMAEFLAKRTIALKQPKPCDDFGQELR